jgi:hypothetical protein
MSIGWRRIGEVEGSDHHCPSCFGEGAVISTLERSDAQFRNFLDWLQALIAILLFNTSEMF